MICPKCKNYTSWRYLKCPHCGVKQEQPSCLDSAYERLAIDQGMNNTPVFPENIEYMKSRQ